MYKQSCLNDNQETHVFHEQKIVSLLKLKFRISMFLLFCSDVQIQPGCYKKIAHKISILRAWLDHPDEALCESQESASDIYQEIIRICVDYDHTSSKYLRGIISSAAGSGHIHVLEDMLNQRANPNLVDGLGGTPFLAAIIGKQFECIRLLVEHGAVITMTNQTIFENHSVFEYLVTIKAFKDKKLLEALNNAAVLGQAGTVQLLVEAGVSINSRLADDNTALMLAASHGHTALIKRLISWGGDPCLVNNQNETALEIAAEHHHEDTARALISPNLRQDQLNRALCSAVRHQLYHLMADLLTAGANPNAQDEEQRSVLLTASELNDHTITEALLAAGANPNQCDSYGMTPIMHIAGHGNIQLLKALIDHQANLNIKNRYRSTPIFWAAEQGHYEIVRTMILNGADLLLINERHQNPKRVAELHGHASVAKLISSGMVRQIFLYLKDHCSMEGLNELIQVQQIHQVSKDQVVNYILGFQGDFKSKHAHLESSIECNREGRPCHALSAYLHMSQHTGFKRFFSSGEHTNDAVAQIKSEIQRLEKIIQSQGVDMGPKLR